MPPVMQLKTKALDDIYTRQISKGLLQIHRQQIEGELRQVGANNYDLWLPETHSMPLFVQPDELIVGVVYGRYTQNQGKDTTTSRGVVIATSHRMLLINKKPLYVNCSEFTYSVVTGLSYCRIGFTITIVLRTRLGDITIRTYNQRSAYIFVHAIEKYVITTQKPLDIKSK